ncbi:hypothetical protein VR7878_03212 [Vibrio ruber DSM 16370]|uniref:Glycine zipper family protein n=1 Tax=Vibrio ruber (strain DSM 16370 / JCM 11486 / BCRC 17186 / CECT 7878 / LMG 23124 / VR1) TaxID=1123498 RepID=A0A1R4LRH3_VIBR1|nr:hypothetical protein [Vibrio ruber]SJN59078.1 hypothetical protein VR7878_03212 [Vibrio ruber DSM 16370]
MNLEHSIETNDTDNSLLDVTTSDIPGRAFFFVVVDEVGIDGLLTRKIYASLDDPYLKAMNLPEDKMLKEVFPERYGLSGKDLSSSSTVAEHVMGINKSKYTSTSSLFPDGSPRFQGKPIYIDINKAKQAGAELVSTREIIEALEKYKELAPKRVKRIDQIISYVRDIDKEVLIANKVPARAIFTPESYTFVKNIGRVGKAVQLFGIVLTAYDLTVATKESIKTESMAPIGAEVIRQSGGWGAGGLGLKAGVVAGAALGIETGPGVFITGAIGGIIFGAAGYFGADWVADFIYEN